MKTQTDRTLYEQTVISIMSRLPEAGILQIVDFAKFIENQSSVHKSDEEEKWNSLLAGPESKKTMREMAKEALEDYHSGKTTEITINKNGKLEPA
jgi:hypothetical protein